ncbi:hypothetical protein LMB54_07650 [Limosilactobacillus reuteri]|uniref:hypothetical protein n=1 Tax=Limosilactobacillus reuteri TaxID=1598 RepID=UPI001E5A2AB4|nr:hypothetical protein [Limosilactobacillus reuteri]MCC4383677.1 hypothetical protein [Limosilactobacillus reuteri]MCC4421003.1 hypothetical protein [Limosilactobacillus reuteri]
MFYYIYNDDGALINVVHSNIQPSNSTTISPFDQNGIVRSGTHFDKTKQAWVAPQIGKTQPTATELMIAKLGIDVAQTQQMIAKLATMIKPQGGQNNE